MILSNEFDNTHYIFMGQVHYGKHIYKFILLMECLVLKNKQNKNKRKSHTGNKNNKMSYLQPLRK